LGAARGGPGVGAGALRSTIGIGAIGPAGTAGAMGGGGGDGGSGATATGAVRSLAAGSTAFPHETQKRVPASFEAPQRGQRTAALGAPPAPNACGAGGST
jgi:hypothetical protein